MVRHLLLLSLIVAVTSSTACTHPTTLRSSPTGATVKKGNEVIGQTPLVVEEGIGPSGGVEFEVQAPDDGPAGVAGQRRRIELLRQQTSWTSAGQGALLGLGACCVLNAVGCSLSGVSFLSEDPTFRMLPLATSSAGALAVALGGTAGYVHGRTGPDEIMVNFLDDRVVSLPPGMVQRVAPSSQPTSAAPTSSTTNPVTTDDTEPATPPKSTASDDAPPAP